MFSRMKFQGKWRDYQQRVLGELRGHLEDRRLHIVAAPGSGKTVLGIEVMRELGRQTLILSPTLTIRNQWTERLHEMFLPVSSLAPDDISYDLRDLGAMTSVTYQALHAIWKNGRDDNNKERRPDFERLIEAFAKQDEITIIVDEAHHLRREWWRALNTLVDALPNATLVALTATPPYDASYAEWSRYDGLCGPVDAEISVPELVRNGDLCPHQDFIHFSLPERGELTLLVERRRSIARLVSDLLADPDFTHQLASHPWIAQSPQYEEAILQDPEYLSSILIMMAAGDLKLPDEPLELLGVESEQVPLLSPLWLEAFLNGYIFDYTDILPKNTDHRKQIEKRLRQLGLIENQRVRLIENRSIFRSMAGSLAKLDSITKIANAEYANLGDRLRMVVLTDYVRASDLPRKLDESFHPAKLGVAPIFETIRRAGLNDIGLGVLTGSLVIIQESACAMLPEATDAAHIPHGHVNAIPLPGCPGYCRITLQSSSNQKMVRLITYLFNRGAIRMLVGTQALLGEGWDAPSINTLVLASNVGSYMLSNQMRGRAIRIDRHAPEKVANIWHLATIEPQTEQFFPASVTRFIWKSPANPYQSELRKLGGDMRLLCQRFEMFEGISNGLSTRISNGIDRLDISSDGWSGEAIQVKNEQMMGRAQARQKVAEKWTTSLGNAGPRSHIHKIVETNYAPLKQSYSQTLQYLAISAVIGAFTSAAGALRQFQSVRGIATLALIFGGLALVYSLPKLFLALRLLIRNGTLERSLHQVGKILLESLSHTGALSHDPGNYDIEIEASLRGNHHIILHHASRAEEKVFLDSLSELLGPIENPRYILVRSSWLGALFRKDYHAVPAILGAKKENAEYLTQCWNKQVGGAKLVFTRKREGRKILLHARSNSMASGFQRYVDRRSQWR